MRVLKFGGTSVGDAERIKNVTRIIQSSLADDLSIIIVVSAIGKTTDQLIEMSQHASGGDNRYATLLEKLENTHLKLVQHLIPVKKQSSVLAEIKQKFNELDDILHGVFLIRECTERSLDLIMSFGERLSAYLISECLKNQQINAEFMDAREIIKTDDQFGKARVDFVKTNRLIKESFKEKKITVVTGFIASNESGVTTTLGRSGSDYTAAIIGSALKVEVIEIWSDADGVMTADPRKVKEAFSIEQMSYNEAMEMTHFGASIIHPPTMQPAMKAGIPIKIRNTFNPEFKGTLITKKSKKNGYKIRGISSIDDIALLRLEGSGLIGVRGVSMRLFGALAQQNINVILITQASSEHSICIAVNPGDTQKAKKSVDQEFELERKVGQVNEIIIENEKSIVAIVGENMQHSPGVSGLLFDSLGKAGINVVAIAQGSSELNVSVVIDRQNENRALKVIHQAFFGGQIKTLHLFLVGTGLIGGCLLKQIKEQQDALKKRGVHLKIIGLANRSRMIIQEEIELKKWEEALQKGEKMDLQKWMETLKNLHLPHRVMIDCTADEKVGDYYEDLLKHKIAIVTPNKKAASGDYQRYQAIQSASRDANTPYLYEVNVGAGLPVISTLKDLINTGDEIIKIEAVLSGTLSYIFNTFDGSIPFSQVVRSAQEKGYTEPDPRDDLNGMDVARKILILARETGKPLELKEVMVENLSPAPAQKAGSINEYFKKLAEFDQEFEALLHQAKEEKKALRYIASFEKGKAKVELKKVDQNHPFFNLSGSDNIVSFTTKRYHQTPLVIKGPGAGAEVTAAGVFAEILRLA